MVALLLIFFPSKMLFSLLVNQTMKQICLLAQAEGPMCTSLFVTPNTEEYTQEWRNSRVSHSQCFVGAAEETLIFLHITVVVPSVQFQLSLSAKASEVFLIMIYTACCRD